MTALNACLTVARLAEAAGDSVPYLENVAKIAVLVFELLEVRFNIFGCMDFVWILSLTCSIAKRKE